MAGRTTIIITHRMEVANGADRILVLEQSRLADAGTPEELAARPGVFVDLVAASYAG
jgi:ABC-type multidrug transport system fused ATPase/permease subunit